MTGNTKAVPKTTRRDATQLLTADHKKVSKLFAEYEKVKDNDAERKQALVRMVCDELTIHAQVEEEILYPALYAAFNEKGDDLVDEAEVEHGTIKQLVATLKASAPDDRLFDANVVVLSEYVKHHVKEEQDEIFPKARKSSALDLERMGEEISVRKAQLMEEYGIEPEKSAPAPRRPGSARRHA